MKQFYDNMIPSNQTYMQGNILGEEAAAAS
jgi:hypothetical protein